VILTGDGANKKPCVWAVLVLADGTMVSGDGAGRVQFWDASLGTRLAGFAEHRADVLALAAAPDGSAVFAAGIDPRLAAFQRVQGKKGARTRGHVLCMTLMHKYLYFLLGVNAEVLI
jgi:U3 small nucleolar RNA-associated protein 4